MEKLLRVLCLEDDLDDFEIITETITSGGFRCVASRVDDREAFVEAMMAFKPDIVLSDHALPQFDSTEALIIAKSAMPQVPFILVTGAVSDEFAVKALKLGADDYVLKSNLARLPNAIRNAFTKKEAEMARVKAAKELAERNEELVKINRELDSFVYSVSHDLRAPLMSILGLTSLAKQERDVDNLNRFNLMIESCVVKLDATLRDIIEYARNARQDVRLEEISFKELLHDAFRKLEFIPGFEKILRMIDVQSRVPFYSDSYRVSVILNNLISNAVKYADTTKQNSWVEVTIVSDDKMANIIFQDNGIGIHEASVSRIFDMFFRGTEKREGAGLGLFIVYETVQMLKGTITVESKLGEVRSSWSRFPIAKRSMLSNASEEV
jgi:signal transduction histidine kinase